MLFSSPDYTVVSFCASLNTEEERNCSSGQQDVFVWSRERIDVRNASFYADLLSTLRDYCVVLDENADLVFSDLSDKICTSELLVAEVEIPIKLNPSTPQIVLNRDKVVVVNDTNNTTTTTEASVSKTSSEVKLVDEDDLLVLEKDEMKSGEARFSAVDMDSDSESSGDAEEVITTKSANVTVGLMKHKQPKMGVDEEEELTVATTTSSTSDSLNSTEALTTEATTTEDVVTTTTTEEIKPLLEEIEKIVESTTDKILITIEDKNSTANTTVDLTTESTTVSSTAETTTETTSTVAITTQSSTEEIAVNTTTSTLETSSTTTVNTTTEAIVIIEEKNEVSNETLVNVVEEQRNKTVGLEEADEVMGSLNRLSGGQSEIKIDSEKTTTTEEVRLDF